MDVDDLAGLDVVAHWLARRDTLPGPEHEVVVLLGSAVLASLEVVARAAAGRILVSGGVGHSTAYLHEALARRGVRIDVDGRSEAEILAELLEREHGVERGRLLLETASTNCGENATLSVALLDRLGLAPRRILLVQDPTMQRRTHACFEHELAGRDTRVDSWAPLVPSARGAEVGEGPDRVWPLARFAALAVGEVRRLRDDERGYGPRGAGFIGHVDVPPPVEAAAARLVARHPHLDRPESSG